MRPLVALALLVAGGALLAAGIAATRPAAIEAVAARPAFPDLAAKLAEVTQIAIVRGSASVTLDGRDTWTVAERDHYPADPSKLRTLLSGLTGLTLAEPRTADPAAYPRLGVEDPAPAATSPTGITLRTASGDMVATLVAGHRHARANGGDSTDVRLPPEPRAWSATGALEADADPAGWLDHRILDIAPADIARIAVTHGDTPPIVVTRGEDGALSLQTPPADRRPDPLALSDTARLLAALALSDVRRGDAPAQPKGVSRVTTKAGMEVTLTVWHEGEDLWATVAASGPGAETVAARTSGWAYKLQSWKERTLLPELTDLTQAPPPPKPAAPAPEVKPAAPAPGSEPAPSDAEPAEPQ